MLKIKRRWEQRIWEQGTGNREQGIKKLFSKHMRYLRCVRVQPSAVSRELKAHACAFSFLAQASTLGLH
ncbi:hypothetical protein BJP34_25175 [Moorena producens PAL-8-15-08-1]|uniref:Uncharacterized protein n=1 Tax=Moorena producens PAL-8-15-08-1 TaxID=1458985 RepID=A0A1D8TXE1_9CYAN|nr:hypothetical protein BJP34_25175 [Moorena producens PAL-8-15-08-1]